MREYRIVLETERNGEVKARFISMTNNKLVPDNNKHTNNETIPSAVL